MQRRRASELPRVLVGDLDSATVRIYDDDVNEAPTVGDVGFAVAENSLDGALIGTLMGSDPDVGDTLTYVISAGNGQGAFRIDPDTGQLTVAAGGALDHETTPAYSLTVRVSDQAGLADSATLTIAVNDVNETPTARDDSWAVSTDGILDIAEPGVLANDSDVDSSLLTAGLAAGTTDGTLDLDDSGDFIYTPDPGFEGMDGFTYTAGDGEAMSPPAQVGILVYDGWLVQIDADSGDAVQFGVTSSATGDIDARIDVEADIDEPLFFFAGNARTGGLLRDMRGKTLREEWMLTVITGASPTVLTWDSASLPVEGLTIRQVSLETGTSIPGTAVDMAVARRLEVSADTSMALRISSTITVFELELFEGWNLISLPNQPLDPTMDAVLAAENVMRRDGGQEAVSFRPAWEWSPALDGRQGQYVSMSQMDACKGAWVYASATCTVSVTGMVYDGVTEPLAQGWNLIGVVERTVLDEHAGFFLPGYAWDPVGGSYLFIRAGDTLCPGLAYWLFAK